MRVKRPKLSSETSIPCLSTRKFVAWGFTPRPGSRVAPVTLGHHHKPFGSARIARTPRALELVRACPRLVALDPWWQRQQESRRGWGIDTRLAPGACSEVPERPRIDATISQRQPCGPGTAHRPGRHRTRLRAARWWPPRRGCRAPATLAPDSDASRTQQSHPSATATLGTRTARPCAGWWLVTTPLLEPTCPTSARRSSRAP